MTRMLLPLIVVSLVLVVGTYFQGVYSERWTRYDSELLDAFTSRLANVPNMVGEWEGVDQDYDEEQFKRSNCRGCVSRIYTSKRTGETVSVYLVSGTARHVTIHTPDWCYVGAGFEMERKPHSYEIDCGPENPRAEFSTTTFLRNTHHMTEHLRIFWTFADNGEWTGPAWAKTEFAGRPALIKLYLITPILDGDSDVEKAPSKRFAAEFLPALNRVLFPKTESEDVVAENHTDVDQFAS